MHALSNPIRRYAWGSPTAIPALLGRQPDGQPQAEMWLGAHPDSPSLVEPDGISLEAWIDAQPEPVLGQDVCRRFGARLPYLLKVLSADAPLSLQVHPTLAQARRGFEAEERTGISRAAANRSYKDRQHKPEMLVALTQFEALCGLRPSAESARMLHALPVLFPGWDEIVELLTGPSPELRGVFERLLSWRDGRTELVRAVASACERRLLSGSEYEREDRTVVALARAYPGDVGVVLALLFNRVTLAPGEAVYLPAGQLHAYLHGTGIEVMASSDNVLRAGLTPKYVDIDEILRIVDFTPHTTDRVEAVVDGVVTAYRVEAAEFELLRVDLGGGSTSMGGLGPRIVLGLAGELLVEAGGSSVALPRGMSVLLSDSDGLARFSGFGAAIMAAVPMPYRRVLATSDPSA